MSLPDALDSRCCRDPLIVPGHWLWRARRRAAETLAGSVVDDNDLRLDGVQKSRRASAIECSVAPCLPYGDLPDAVGRARQFHLLLPVEIGKIEESKLPICEQRADHELVLGTFRRPVLRRRTEWI